MKNFMRMIAAAFVAVSMLTFVAATSASAAPTIACKNATPYLYLQLMCTDAWAAANLSPLSEKGVIAAGQSWCNDRGYPATTTSTNRANANLSKKVSGNLIKMRAISNAADKWIC